MLLSQLTQMLDPQQLGQLIAQIEAVNKREPMFRPPSQRFPVQRPTGAFAPPAEVRK